MTRRALALSFLDRYAGLLIYVGSSMVLARLLSPAEIGVFSVTMVLVGVLAGLRDMGATSYVIQEKELTQDRIRAAWALQVAVGVGLGMFVALAAWPVAAFYGEAQMAPILWVLAANFVINPIGSITVAWWRREMNFQRIAVMRFVGGLTGAAVAIYLAWRGHGAFSLAWASLATTVAGIVIALALRPPQLPVLPSLREIRRVFAFGGKVTGMTIVDAISEGAPEAFLGRVQDMAQAGFYSRASGLVSMFNRLVMDAVNSVTLPLFAQKQREGAEIKQLYLRAIAMITGLGWPFLACLAIGALPIVRILYGDQWDEAVGMTRILCLSMALGLATSIAPSLLLARGLADAAMRVAIAITTLHLVVCLIGAKVSLHALGWALVASALVASMVWMIKVKPLVGFAWRELGTILSQSLVLAAVTALPFGLIAMTLGFNEGAGAWPKLSTAAVSGLLLFIAGARLVRHPLFEEISQVYLGFRSWMT